MTRDYSLQYRRAVASVRDTKVLVNSNLLTVPRQEAARDRMEGTQDQFRLKLFSNEPLNSLFHLPCCLDGESTYDDVPWL
jgi:hypothetical protein